MTETMSIEDRLLQLEKKEAENERKLFEQIKKTDRMSQQLNDIVHEQTNLVAALREKAKEAVHAAAAYEHTVAALETATKRANSSTRQRESKQ